MYYVSEYSHRLAREMEARLAALPASSGILFVCVQAGPSEDGVSTEFHVRLGISRSFGVETGRALVKKMFEPEAASGLKILVGVYRGVLGACRDDSTSTASPPTSKT